MTSEAERNRLEFVLGAVYDDHITDWKGGKQAFIEQYMKKAARKHPTHRLVDVCVDLYYASPHRAKWYVEKEFADWLVAEDPMLNFGEIEGKYSEVERNFSECCDIVDDYFLIEPHDDVKPEDLPEELESSYEKYADSVPCTPCSQYFNKRYFKRSELLAVTEEGDEEPRPECAKCVIDAHRLAPISKLEFLSEDAHNDHDLCDACHLMKDWRQGKGLKNVECFYCDEKYYAGYLLLIKPFKDSKPEKFCVKCAKADYSDEHVIDAELSDERCPYDIELLEAKSHMHCEDGECEVCDFVKAFNGRAVRNVLAEWHAKGQPDDFFEEPSTKRLRKE